MTAILLAIKDFIIQHPYFFKEWVCGLLKSFKKNPVTFYMITALALLPTVYIHNNLPHIRFVHSNYHGIKDLQDDIVADDMKIYLRTMGRGSSILKMAIFYEKSTDDKKTAYFSKVFSCISSKEDCIIDARDLHKKRYSKFYLDEEDVANIELDELELYSTFHRDYTVSSFKENSPLCVKIIKDNIPSPEFISLSELFPSLGQKIGEISNALKKDKSKSYIEEACFSKIRHPDDNNVIYIFIFTFWRYGGVEPEKLNYDSTKSLLRKIGDTQKQNLLTSYR